MHLVRLRNGDESITCTPVGQVAGRTANQFKDVATNAGGRLGANPKWTPWHSRRWPFLCSTFANKAETEAMRRATFAKGGKGGPNKMFRQQAAGPDRPGETGKDQTAAPGSKRAIGGPRGVDVHGE